MLSKFGCKNQPSSYSHKSKYSSYKLQKEIWWLVYSDTDMYIFNDSVAVNYIMYVSSIW